jgi:hypothetical protein
VALRHTWRIIAVGALIISVLAASPSRTAVCSCAGGDRLGDVAFVGYDHL